MLEMKAKLQIGGHLANEICTEYYGIFLDYGLYSGTISPK